MQVNGTKIDSHLPNIDYLQAERKESLGNYIAKLWLNNQECQESKSTMEKMPELTHITLISIEQIKQMDFSEAQKCYQDFMQTIAEASDSSLSRLSHRLAENSSTTVKDNALIIFNVFVGALKDKAVNEREVTLEINVGGLSNLDAVLFKASEELNDLNALIKAKASCENSIDSATYVLNNISRCGIKSKEKLFELAKFAIPKSQCDINRVEKYFRDLQIENEEEKRFEIAMLFADQKMYFNFTIKKFNISNQEFIFQIANRFAETCPPKFFSMIRDFGIESELKRIEVLKTCVKNFAVFADHRLNGPLSTTIKNFYVFNIVSPDATIEIIKLFAEKDVLTTAQNLCYFNITDSKVLNDLLWFFAKHDPYKTALSLQFFNDFDRKLLIDIAHYCALQCGIKITPMLIKNKLPMNSYSLICHQLFTKGQYIETIPELKNWINSQFSETNFLAVVKEMIEDVKDTKVKKDRIHILAESLYLMDLCLSKKQIDCLDKELLIRAILKFPFPSLRLPLCQTLIDNIRKHNESIFDINKLSKNETHEWMRITRALLNCFCSQGMSKEVAEKVISNTIERANSTFYNGLNNKTLIGTLNLLLKEQNLTILEKQQILARIFDKNKVPCTIENKEKKLKVRQQENESENAFKKLYFANQLTEIALAESKLHAKKEKLIEIFKNFDMKILSKKSLKVFAEQLTFFEQSEITDVEELNKEISKFKNLFATTKNVKRWTSSIQSAATKIDYLGIENQILQNLAAINSLLLLNPSVLKSSEINFQDTLVKCVSKLVPLGEIENFATNLHQKFGVHINDLMTYIAKITQLKNEEALKSIGDYVTAVLTGKFEEVRNDTTHNLHLRTIAEKQPTVLKNWLQQLETIKITIREPK